MLFNSFIFWGFFVLVLALYRALPHRGQNHLLLLASYVFYGYWDWRFLSLILFSTVVDYILGARIAATEAHSTRKQLLIVSVVINLGVLGFFKYFGFFVTELNSLLAGLGIHSAMPVLRIILPVGISFYTFQSLSYTFDIYRRQTVPANRFSDFALYVSFFPQLVAGPIERSSDLLPQVLAPRRASLACFGEGIYLVLIGLVKKVVIADNMAVVANSIFSQPAEMLSGTEVMIGVYAFAFQIYGDFSGYSNIAQGLARMLGFRLSWNFRMPYFAQSPSDFWRRWHISLSTWLRDYLYIPLGGNQGKVSRTYRNLALTMLLGGLWHGAAWTFIFWGAFHGAILIIYRLWPALGGEVSREAPPARSVVATKSAAIFRAVIMFHLVCFSWLLFRAQGMEQVGGMLGAVVNGGSLTEFAAFSSIMLVIFAAPLLAYEWWLEQHDNQLAILERGVVVQALMFLALILALMIFPPLQPQAFIYFQF